MKVERDVQTLESYDIHRYIVQMSFNLPFSIRLILSSLFVLVVFYKVDFLSMDRTLQQPSSPCLYVYSKCRWGACSFRYFIISRLCVMTS